MPEPIAALTICQPYAHLIVTPQHLLPAEAVQKRVENRMWNCSHRGLLAIHAGQSRDWLVLRSDGQTDACGVAVSEMTFGAIVGFVELVGCVPIRRGGGKERFLKEHLELWPWLREHPHAEGPFGLILSQPRKLVTPIPARGMVGVWRWTPPGPVDELEYFSQEAGT